MSIDNDWGWIWFAVPSAVSFLASAAVMATVARDKINRNKRFYQLVAIIAGFDSVQCFSWFLGPRYETHSVLCAIQEYLFQLGTLMQGVTSVVICTTIYNAIKHGRIIPWTDQRVVIWVTFAAVCLVLSCAFGTASLFCPFNEDSSLSYRNLSKTSKDFSRLLVYCCCYLLPMTACFMFNWIYSFRSRVHARRLSVDSIRSVARQLKLYPIALGLAMFPLCAFLMIVILAGKEVHILLYIGAILVSSIGTGNAIVFFKIMRADLASQAGFRGQNTTLTSESKVTKQLLDEDGIGVVFSENATQLDSDYNSISETSGKSSSSRNPSTSGLEQFETSSPLTPLYL